jgi:LPXTG-motif cell wall-anchored protein
MRLWAVLVGIGGAAFIAGSVVSGIGEHAQAYGWVAVAGAIILAIGWFWLRRRRQ